MWKEDSLRRKSKTNKTSECDKGSIEEAPAAPNKNVVSATIKTLTVDSETMKIAVPMMPSTTD